MNNENNSSILNPKSVSTESAVNAKTQLFSECQARGWPAPMLTCVSAGPDHCVYWFCRGEVKGLVADCDPPARTKVAAEIAVCDILLTKLPPRVPNTHALEAEVVELRKEVASLRQALSLVRAALVGVELNPGPTSYVNSFSVTGTTQVDQLMYTAGGAESWNVAAMCSIYGGAAGGHSGVSVMQLVPSAGAVQAIVTSGALPSQTVLAFAASGVSYEAYEYVGSTSVVMASGDKLYWSVKGTAAASVGAAIITTLSVGGAVAATDVRIVGLDALQQPLWVSAIKPNSAPIPVAAPAPLEQTATLSPSDIAAARERVAQAHAASGGLCRGVGLVGVEQNPGPGDWVFIDHRGITVAGSEEEIERISAEWHARLGQRVRVANPDDRVGAARLSELMTTNLFHCLPVDDLPDDVGEEWDGDPPEFVAKSDNKMGNGSGEKPTAPTPPRQVSPKKIRPDKTHTAKDAQRYLERVAKVARQLRTVEQAVRWSKREDEKAPSPGFVKNVLAYAFPTVRDDTQAGAVILAQREEWPAEREARRIVEIGNHQLHGVSMDLLWMSNFGCPWHANPYLDQADGFTPKYLHGTHASPSNGCSRGNGLVGVATNPGPAMVQYAGWCSRDGLLQCGDVEANPGPKFPKGMMEVNQLSDLLSVFADAVIGNRAFDPIQAASAVAALGAYVNPQVFDVTAFSAWRATIMQTNNTLTAVAMVQAPEIFLTPRQVRNGAAAVLIAATQRLFVNGTNLHYNGGKALTLTPLGAAFDTQNAAGATLMLNQNQAAINGYATMDLAQVVADKTVNNWNPETMLVKLLLLLSVSRTIPAIAQSNFIETTAGNVDAFTQAANPVVVTLGANDSAVFGEACGGITSLFPFSNVAGTIAFHISLQTVPEAQRANAWFIPRGLIDSQAAPQSAIAALVFAIAEWAPVMWTVNVNTLDTAGGNAAAQKYVHNASTVFVPGQTEIHVVLSRDGPGGVPPGAQQTANENVDLQPTWGPTATTSVAANAVLDISFLGTLRAYNLAEYLRSWATNAAGTGPAIGSATIVQLLTTMNGQSNIMAHLHVAADKVAYLVNRYSPLQVEATGTATKATVNSLWGATQMNGDGFQAVQTTANFPQASAPQGCLWIGATRPRAWSKIWSGCFVPEDRGDCLQHMPAWLNHEGFSYFLALRARWIASAFAQLYAYTGLCQDVWSTALVQTPMNGLRELVRAAYADYAGTHGVAPAMLGDVLAAALTKSSSYSPALAEGSLHMLAARQPPTTSMRCHYSVAGAAFLTNSLPSILPDIWFNSVCQELTCDLAPFPPGYKRDGLTGLKEPSWQEVILGNGAFYGPFLPPTEMQPTLGYNDTPPYARYAVWNARLIRHTGAVGRAVVERFYDGTVVPSVVPAGSIAYQKVITPTVSMAGYTSSRVATASTLISARFIATGTRIWPVWAAASSETNRELLGVLPAYIETWQAGSSLIPPAVLTNDVQTSSLKSLFGGLRSKEENLNASSSEGLAGGALAAIPERVTLTQNAPRERAPEGVAVAGVEGVH